MASSRNWPSYRSREVVAKGYAEEVAVRCDGREIARHARGFRKGELVLNPLHYLPVLRRKASEGFEPFVGVMPGDQSVASCRRMSQPVAWTR